MDFGPSRSSGEAPHSVPVDIRVDPPGAGSDSFEGGLQVVAERTDLATREDGFSRRTLWRRAGTGAVVAGAFIAGSPASLAFAAPANQTDATTLRLNAGHEPDTIDPQKASFVDEIDKIMRVFRNLLQFDKTITLVPDQAAALPVASDGGKTLTFTLKSGLTYSDGKPLTAKDYEYGWKRHLDPVVAGEYASLGFIIKGAEAYNSADLKKTSADDLKKLRDAVGVKALNDATLEFTLTDPAPWFMSVLATWCGLPSREDLVTKGGETWTEPATYVGNGPYILTQWEHQNRMQFKANAKFHTGAPPIETIDYAMINEPAVAFAAYLNNELDGTGVQREDKARVDGDPVLSKEFHQFAGSCTFYIGFNNAKKPFDNMKVRQALSAAVDRSGYVKNILGGQGIPARQFLPPGFPGHFETELEEQVYNPELAQKLLAEAGYPWAKGFPQLKLTYSSNARNKARNEALADMLRKVLWIDVVLDPVEARAYTALLKKPETTPPMFILGWCQDYADPQNWYSLVFTSDSSIDHTSWKNKEYDRLCNLGDKELDVKKRTDYYRQAAQLLLAEAPVAFFYHSVVWVLVKSRIQGYREDPLEYFVGEHDLYNFKIAK
ncbi:MAG: peptide ABC transporter substrate-binding protein [Chloroflexi bacterium]|nr:peptide ABC transporter substrate-binding protein [Chloroflexota bacterium]